MGFFSKKKKEKQVGEVPFMTFLTDRFGGGLNTARERKYLHEYRNWVFACVTARSEEIGAIKLHLFNEDGEVFEHPVIDLLNKVNPSMTKDELFAGTQAFLDLDGNAFWFLAREKQEDGKGQIKEIWLLRPDRVMIIKNKENPLEVEGYVYMQEDGKRIPLAKNEIFHAKNFNPTGNHPFPHRGKSIVEAASWAIDTDNESREWNFKFFKNSARPDGVLQKEGEASLGPDEFRRLREQWNQEHQGASKAHKVAILSGGLKWQTIGRSQTEMDFIEQRRFSRDEILALFRVPKTVIGIVEDVNRANAEASDFIFANRTIKPLMQQLVDSLNEFLLPEFIEEGEEVFFDFESPVPQDRMQITSEYEKALKSGWMSRNEVREKEGLIATVNGNQILAPFNLREVDTVPEEEEQKTAPKKPAAKKKEEKKNGVDKVVDKLFESKFPEPEQKETRSKEMTEVGEANFLEMWKKAFGINVDPLKALLIEFFENQKKEVLDNIREEFKGLEAKEYRYKQLPDLMFDEAQALATGISLITPVIQQHIEQSGQQAALLTGVTFAADAFPLTEFVEQRSRFFADSISKTTRDDLFETLSEGIDAGEGIPALTARVDKVYGEAIGFRAERIARTEVSASSNFAVEQAYVQGGITQKKWAVVSPDDQDCVVNAGVVVGIGEEFPSGHQRPPVHPNCMCTILPVAA